MKLATNGPSNKAFLLTSFFFSKGLSCPCPEARKGSFWNWYKMMGIIKALEISLPAQDQLSGEHYRTIDPLVIILSVQKFLHANSIDPGLMLDIMAFDLVLHYLPRCWGHWVLMF